MKKIIERSVITSRFNTNYEMNVIRQLHIIVSVTKNISRILRPTPDNHFEHEKIELNIPQTNSPLNSLTPKNNHN